MIEVYSRSQRENRVIWKWPLPWPDHSSYGIKLLDIGFLATDRKRNDLPPDLREIDLIPLTPGEFGIGFG